MTSRPAAAPTLAALLLLIAVSAVAGCAEDRKIDQIRRGIDSVDQHSQEIEKAAEQSP